jgi:hypothetical protein
MITIPPIPNINAITSIEQLLKAFSSNQNNSLLNVPTDIASLPVGTLIEGVVASKDIHGNLTIATPRSNFIVNTPLPIDINNEVNFKVLDNSSEFKLQLVFKEPNNNPHTNSLLNNKEIIFSFKPNTKASISNTQQPIDTTVIYNDVNFTPSEKIDFIVGTMVKPNLPAINNLLLKAINNGAAETINEFFIPNNENFSTGINNALKNMPEDRPIIFRTYIPFTPTDEVKDTQTNNPLIIRVVAIQNNKNNTIIDTSIGVIKIPNYVPLKPNDMLELVALNPKLAPTTPLTKFISKDTFTTKLNDVLEIINTHIPLERKEPLKEILLKEIPTIEYDDLGSKIFKFFASLQTNINLIGPSERQELSKYILPEQIEQLTNEFQLLKSVNNEKTLIYNLNNPDSWNSYLIPIYDGNIVNHAALYVRDESSSQNNTDNSEQVTRFIVEIDTILTGEMQIDGFIRKKPAQTQVNSGFNLIIKTKKELSNDIKSDILKIFNTVNEITGQNGGLTFRVEEKFLTKPFLNINNDLANSQGIIV